MGRTRGLAGGVRLAEVLEDPKVVVSRDSTHHRGDGDSHSVDRQHRASRDEQEERGERHRREHQGEQVVDQRVLIWREARDVDSSRVL